MSASDQYGTHYWCVTGDGEPLYLYADRMEVTVCGGLIAWGGYRKEGGHPQLEQPLWAAAPGQWRTFFAASLIDRRGVALDLGPNEPAAA